MIQSIHVIEKDRVVLACMKNAGGDVQKLKDDLNEAPGYYREIIAEAEQEKADIIEKDKKQCLNWFNRGKATPGG